MLFALVSCLFVDVTTLHIHTIATLHLSLTA